MNRLEGLERFEHAKRNLPPRPELHPQIPCEAAGHDIDESPLAGIYLGVTCHARLE